MDHGLNDWDSLRSKSCYSAQEEIKPTENFELSDTHIIFYYNPYDIACYAQGATEVKLAFENLTGFRKKW